MAAKMAIYNKKYKKIFTETGKLQESACKIYLTDFWTANIILVTSQWCY